MSTAISTHTGAGPLSLMSCVRESSPPQDAETDYENEKNAGGQKKKRFWNKWFGKRKNKVADDAPSPNEAVELPKENQRSRSTSELSENEEPIKRRNGTPMHPGLSVSHDSVFHSPNSGSEIELEGAQSSSSLSIHHQHHADRLQTELTERLRLRRGRGDTSEDDEGLPRSPCNSPTVTDKTAAKDNPKSHSTCSEGSLLSVGSSEMDDDSFGQHSVHSSKLSLEDKNITDGDYDLDFNVKNTSAPLNHSGARHRASVKPQRRYGAPRKKRLSGSVLPTTPEVNEDTAIRSLTPDVNSTKEIVTELYASSTHAAITTTTNNATSTSSSSKSMLKSHHRAALTEKQLKCSSLPPGLAGPGSDTGKLNRSRSNAGTKYQEEFVALGEEDETGKDNKKSDSFLGRIFPRRSGKKKKSKEEKVITSSSSSSIITTTSTASKQETIESKEFVHFERKSEITAKPIPVPRSGPAARQRIQPSDIPASPELGTAKSSPDRSHQPASPLHIELEHHLQQRLGFSASPKTPPIRTPPISPKLQRSPLTSPPKSPLFYPKLPPKSQVIEKVSSKHSRSEETRSKVIISGLSPFQQRINNLEEEDCDGFKSLNDLPIEKPTKLVAKSHSFKINNNEDYVETRTTFAALASAKSTTHEIQSTKRLESEEIRNLDTTETDNKSKEIVEEDVKIEQQEEIVENLEEIPPPSVIESKDLLDEEINKVYLDQSESKEFGDSSDFLNSGITISGPRHKAIVSVTNHESTSSEISTTKSETIETKHTETVREIKEQQISITKIQVKQEFTSVTKAATTAVPEFMNIQLHKVEKPVNNVILTAGFQSPKPEEQHKTILTDLPDVVTCNNPPKTIDESEQTGENLRKFSKEDIEIIDKIDIEDENKKHVATALVTITTMTPPVPTRIFKKSDFQIRKSLVAVGNSEKPILKTKSNSLDIVESIKNNEDNPKLDERNDLIKAKTQSVNDLSEMTAEPVVPLRRKSMANKQKQDDEPELMKVFARRSLKLKDGESESLSQQVIKMMEESNTADVKSRDSDKENQLDSPSEERKKIIPKFKEPLLETKFVEAPAEVTLRKSNNNTINNQNNKLYSSYQRTVSLNNAKTNDLNNYDRIQKQNPFADRPKTDHWINYKGADGDPCAKICQDDIMTSMAEKTLIEEEFCTKPKNFNQRKAEWEKRAQEASKKTSP